MKSNLMIQFVVVLLGWAALANAEAPGVQVRGNASVHVTGKVKAKVARLATSTVVRKPVARPKPPAKKPSPRQWTESATKPNSAPAIATPVGSKPTNAIGSTPPASNASAAVQSPASVALTAGPAPVSNESAPINVPDPSSARVVAMIGGAAISGGKLPDVSRVLTGLRRSLPMCWDSPEAPSESSGVQIRLTLTINPDGTVEKTQHHLTGDASASTVQCVESRFVKATFESPEKKPSTLVTTVSFIPAT